MRKMVNAKKIMNGFWIMLLLGNVLVSRLAWADEARFEATVETSKFALGQTTQLVLTMTGGQFAEAPELPAVDGLDIRYLGPSTKVSIVNGNMSSMTSHIYLVLARQTGKFTIPAVTVSVGGKTVTSQPIELEVVDSGAAVGSGGAGASANTAVGGNSSASLEDKIFLTLALPKEEVFLNEKVPVTIKIFVNRIAVQDIQFPKFELNGFLIDDTYEHKQYQQVVGGVAYQVVEFNTNIYPARTGELAIGPATVTATALFENSRGSNDRWNSPFGDDFLNGFFNTYERRQLTVKSAAAKLNVLPWPEEGKPVDFSGAVGQFGFEASAAPNAIKLGDPVTLKMKVSGSGNLKNVTLPAISDSAQYKTYEPQIKLEGNVKSGEQIVIPQMEGIKEIPAVSFAYFDPQEKKYKKLSQGPFSVAIAKPKPGEDFRIIQFDPSQKSFPSATAPATVQETLGRDIIFIKDYPGIWIHRERSVFNNGWYWLLWGFTLGGWGSAWLWYRQTHRLKTDPVFARKLRAPRKAREGLAKAKVSLERQDSPAFHDELMRTLQEYFGDKCHQPAASVSLSLIQSQTAARGVKPQVLEGLPAVFTDCDLARFALTPVPVERMRASLQTVEQLIDVTEKVWR